LIKVGGIMKQEKDREVYNQKTLEAMKEAKEITRDLKYPRLY